jgi:hypothetical protein
MIGVKQAVESAKQYAFEILGDAQSTVEEVERDVYKDRQVWQITLGFPTNSYSAYAVPRSVKDYKSFFVDVETGETLAMKIRELTT